MTPNDRAPSTSEPVAARSDPETAAAELLDEAHLLLAARGPLEVDELADALDLDDDEVDLLTEDPALVFVAGDRLACAHATLGGSTLTHLMSSAEAAEGLVELGSGLMPLEAVSCSEGHLHLQGGRIAEPHETADHRICLSLDELGLPAVGEGASIGFAISTGADEPRADEPLVVPLVLDEVPAATDELVARLRASFERFGHGAGIPVTPLQLLCQLLLDAPALSSEPLPPLVELLEAAGFEVRDGYTAPPGADWAALEQVRSLARVAARRGLGALEAQVLTALVQAAERSAAGGRDGRPSAKTRESLAHRLCDSELADAFAEATRDEPDIARAFVRQLREGGGRRHEAGLWWCESLVVGRAGDVEAAQGCLRSAIAADPSHVPALVDAAWYASDGGDAAEAARLLARAEDDDEGRLALLRQLSAASTPVAAHVGRNDPCPCGSGRKYKQCCLAGPTGATSLPLGDRVGWLWEKLRWWLERVGPMDEMVDVALLLQGTPPPDRSADASTRLAADLDLAASLVLFADGAVADFLAQRSPLLPADEANLVAQWALGGPSVHEVGECRAGEGFNLRDLRTGDVVQVRERTASQALRDGDLVFAHPVFDGTTHQIVGGIVPVTLHQRDPLMDLLDGEEGAYEIADELARTRRAPTLVNTEGEPTVLCRGAYRLADPAAAVGCLDAIFERQERDTWAEMAEHDGRRIVRATVAVDGETLTLFANSEERFSRAKTAVSEALGPLDRIEETRERADEAVRRLRAEGTGPTATGSTSGTGTGTGSTAATGSEPDPSPAEVAAAIEQFVREREVAWLDEPVPALGGLTPRQAADDPTRREDLFALLHEYERAVLPEGAVSYDVSRLRRHLGLEPG